MAGTSSQAADRPHETVSGRRVLSFGGGMIELLPAAGYEVRYTPEAPVIGFAFEFQQGSHAFASDRARAFAARPNGLAYVPAGCEVMSCSAAGGEYLSVRGLFEAAAGDDVRFSDVVDPAAIRAAHSLRRLMLRGQAQDAAAIEAALASLLAIVDAVRTGAHPASQPRSRLTQARLRRVIDYVEAHVDQAIMVRDLAGVVGLSVGYFSRSFKAATGMSAHGYVLERRLARARRLLGQGRASLSEIAFSCGFSSHAHMSAQFQRRYGAPPSALREAAQVRRASR